MIPDRTYGAAKEDRLNEFLWWMCERQEIFRKRFILGEDPPWTDDNALKSYHFCHVYRELDRGTQYLLNNIVNRKDNRNVLFNVIFYRLLNRPDSYEAAGGFTHVDDFNADQVVSNLKAFNESNPVFSSAYRVSAHKFADSDSKIENVVYGILDEVRKDINYYLERMNVVSNLERAFTRLKEIDGVGDFLAYELVTDLNYGFLDCSENDFVNIGPGAENGLLHIWDESDEKYIDWLRVHSRELFTHFDLELFRWNGCRKKELTLRDIEHSLCEYAKFRRAKTQTNPNLRHFTAMPGKQSGMDAFE
jgi:hypothetical protein